MVRTVKIVLVMVLVSLGLSACGVRGPLQPPPGAVDEPAPDPKTGEKPHKPFILDGIL